MIYYDWGEIKGISWNFYNWAWSTPYCQAHAKHRTIQHSLMHPRYMPYQEMPVTIKAKDIWPGMARAEHGRVN